MPITHLALGLVLVSSLIGGCVFPDDDELEYAEDESEVTSQNKLGMNKLGMNKLGMNKLGMNKLGMNSLESRAMMDTEAGREVMSYIVSCALPTTKSMTVQDTAGVSYTYQGWLNLAPNWATKTPTVVERRWVSACLLARTNAFSIPVSISMRHDSYLPLLSSAAERAAYPNAEGAFYGDLFTTPQTWYACSNRTWTAFTPGNFRACALSPNGVTTDCGFSYAGICDTKCTDKTAPFGSCKGGVTTYKEVITIFLTGTQQQGGTL